VKVALEKSSKGISMQPIADPCIVTPDECLSEVAIILAAGILRLHTPAAIARPKLVESHLLAYTSPTDSRKKGKLAIG
jgi:hypothetical protein